MRISLEFIEFFLRARPEEDLISQRGKGAIGMTFPKEYYMLPVVPILGLEEGAVGESSGYSDTVHCERSGCNRSCSHSGPGQRSRIHGAKMNGKRDRLHRSGRGFQFCQRKGSGRDVQG